MATHTNPYAQDDKITVSETEGKQAVELKSMRHVLWIGTLGAAIAIFIAYLLF